MQNIIRKKLKNNLNVEFIVDSSFAYSVICFEFGVGSFHDDKNLMGIAHLFEHLVGKRTKKFREKSGVISEIEKQGIEFNAFTYPQYTLYLHKQENQKILASLDLMVEILYNSSFVIADLEKEKKVVLQEGEQAKQTESFLMWQELQKNLLRNEMLAYGTKETLTNISLKMFSQFYLQYKSLENTKVLIAVSDERVIKKITNKLEKIKSLNLKNQIVKHSSETIKTSVGESGVKFRDGESSNLILGYDLAIPSQKDLATLMILSAILSGGIGSLLNKKLRDEMGMVYWVHAYNYFLGKNNIFVISTNCSNDKLELVEKEIFIILKKISTHIDGKLIKNVLESIKFRIYKNADPDSCILDLACKSSLDLPYLTPAETVKNLDKITNVDVKNMMKKILENKNKTKIVIN